MAKEKAPYNPFPIPEQHTGNYELGENFFTNPSMVAGSVGLRDYAPGQYPTRDEQLRTVDLMGDYRISASRIGRKMITTRGKQNEDPMDEMRVSRNDKVRRARDSYYPVRPDQADEYNTKLVRDQEEIDLSLDELQAIEKRRVEIKEQLEKKRLFGVHKLSVALNNLLMDEEYLQRRVSWLSGLRDSVQGKREDEPEFDADAVREEHDYITEGLLYRKSSDGTRLIDQLQESAAGQAQKALRETGKAPLNGYDQYGNYTGAESTEQNPDTPE